MRLSFLQLFFADCAGKFMQREKDANKTVLENYQFCKSVFVQNGKTRSSSLIYPGSYAIVIITEKVQNHVLAAQK